LDNYWSKNEVAFLITSIAFYYESTVFELNLKGDFFAVPVLSMIFIEIPGD
jgi:hypothetical protein